MKLKGAALLDAIRYLPSIRSRQAELRGYSELQPATKDGLHPIISLGRLGRVDSAPRILESIVQKVGACFLDLNPILNQSCAEYEELCDPRNNYEAWRKLASEAKDVIPLALLRDGSTERPFIRQVLSIENAFGVVVVRSRQPRKDLPRLQAALSAVDDVNNLLIVLDFGYLRDIAGPQEADARFVISALRTTDPFARVAVMGSSFPRIVSVYGEQSGSLPIIERDLHAQIGGDEVAIYGDHAAIYPEPFEPSMSRWVPRIDYCLDYMWKFERHREEDDGTGGYVECAENIVASAYWEPAFADLSWGASIIRATDAAKAVEPGFGAPANWIAARVNMHIERQHALSLIQGYEDPDEIFN